MKQQSMNKMIGNFQDIKIKETNFTPEVTKNPNIGATTTSRLNQWKLPSIDPVTPTDQFSLEAQSFSRAPGTISSLNLGNSNEFGSQLRDSSGWPNSGLSQNNDLESDPSYGGLVSEFEPGKPWKGSQMKSIEDDLTMTPGRIGGSPLSICSPSSQLQNIKENDGGGGGNSNEIFQSNKNSPNQDFGLSSNTWSFNPNFG